MAIATGTAIALGVAAGTAVGGVAAAKAQSGAAKHAASVQAGAQREALAYEREQDQYLRSRYEKEDAREDQARAAYQAYLQSQGRGGGAAPGGGGAMPAHLSAAFANARAGQPDVSAKPGQTLQQLAGPMPSAPVEGSIGPMDQPVGPIPDLAGSMADASTGQGRTLQDLSEWNDWHARGLGA